MKGFHPAQKFYQPEVLRAEFPNGCDLELAPFEIFEHPLYGDEACPLAIGYSEKLGREIVFNVFISGDEVCDLEECFHEFYMEEYRLVEEAAE